MQNFENKLAATEKSQQHKGVSWKNSKKKIKDLEKLTKRKFLERSNSAKSTIKQKNVWGNFIWKVP